MSRISRKIVRLAVFAEFILFLSISLQGQSTRSIGLRMAVKQAGCPLMIQSAKSTTEFLFEEIKLKNVSAKTVVGVTFGIAYHSITTIDKFLLPVQTKSYPTRIGPGDEVTIKASMISAQAAKEELEKKPDGKLEAELGITRVEFDDASQYLYDPEPALNFEISKSGNLIQDGTVCTPCQNNSADAVTPMGYFTCVGVAGQCTYCTNNLTSCTMGVCPMNQGECILMQCPQQKCSYVP
jgi:hypothetical protein